MRLLTLLIRLASALSLSLRLDVALVSRGLCVSRPSRPRAEDGHKSGCTSVPMFDLWYYGRRIGATDAPTIYDERGHEHRALIRRLHHSAPDHEPPRWCGCPRRLLRARRPLWGSTMAASSASSGGTGAAGPVWAAAASTAARKAAEGLESGQSASQALRPLSHSPIAHLQLNHGTPTLGRYVG